MIQVTVDCRKIDTRIQLHGIIRDQLSSVLEENGIEYTGNNLDALHDVLTSMKDKPEFILICPEAARENVGVYIDNLQDMLEDCDISVTAVQDDNE